jgi:hypothetical protein
MWAGLVDWARTQLLTSQPPLANPEDIAIPQHVNTGDDAIELIRRHHASWLQAKQSAT